MSDLPRYTRTPNIDESETEVLVKKGDRDSLDLVDEEDVPSYPPRAGPSGTGVKNVTYEFAPRWPMKGDRQCVLGVLGRDKEETLVLVRKVFSALEEIPDERIHFHASFGESPPSWSRLMDEVWPQFAERPPTSLFVTVKDGPGDAAKRNRMQAMAIAAAITFVAMIFGLVVLLAHFFPSEVKRPAPTPISTTST